MFTLRKSHLSLAWTLFALALCASCAEKTTNFEERRRSTKVNLTVAPADLHSADATADATAAAESLPNEATVNQVFDGIYSDVPATGAETLDAAAGSGTAVGAGSESTASDPEGNDQVAGGDVTAPPTSTTTATSGNETLGDASHSGGHGSGKGQTTGEGDSDGTSGGSAHGSDGDAKGSGDGEAPSPDSTSSDDGLSRRELAACAALQGVAGTRIKVVGNQPQATITSSSILAIRVTGNQPRLELTLTGGEGVQIAGLCLFLAGNQAEAQVDLNVPVGRIVYVGRGNQSDATIDVHETGALDWLAADLSGNRAHLTVKGLGSHPCSSARLSGHDTKFDCQ